MLTRTQSFVLCSAMLVLLLTSAQGMTAPFCTITERTTSCSYTDVQACQQAAEQQMGVCTVNPQALQVPAGVATPFCLINSTGTYCYYTEFKACQLAAVQYKGMCVVNPHRFPR